MISMNRIDLIGSAFRVEARLGPLTRALGPRGIGLALLAMALLAGMAFGSAPSEAEEPASEEEQQFLVSNLGVGIGGTGGIQRTLYTDRPGFAQAFTTGTKTGGYALGSLGIQVTHFYDGSTVGDHLRVTINGVASAGGPGDGHCTLANPSGFPTPGVIAFEAPTGAGSCPQLAAVSTYFVVIEWVNPGGTGSFALIPQTYPTEESPATEEDPGGAEGWSIADQSHYLSVSSQARTWTAFEDTASFKVVVKQGAQANSPATGLPTITGTAQVGQVLTADTTGITDEDGLTSPAYSYQWVSNDGNDDTDIQDATDSTYEVSDADVGNTIKVRVTFSDDRNNQETLTSAATGPVEEAPQEPLTASTHGVPQSHDGENVFTFELRFSEDLKSGFSFKTLRDHAFTVTGGDVTRAKRLGGSGNTRWTIHVQPDGNGDVTLVLPVTADCDADHAICAGDGRPLSNRLELTVSGPQDAAQNSLATGQPTISGTAQAGQILTADTAGIDDTDGLTNPGYSYQWIRNDGNSDTDMQDATASTYEVSDEDVGNTIKVRVTFNDDSDNEETLTSAATAEVTAHPNSPATGAPTISGEAQAGQTLTADTSGIDDTDGLTNVSYGYQWVSNDGNADADIEDAAASTYAVSDDDVGQTIKVRVSFTDDRDNDEALTSAATAEVAARPNTPATGLPTISGTAQAGQTLTADTSGIDDDDGLTNPGYSNQWIRNDGNADADIQDATASTYEVTNEDVGNTIKVRVTFSDDAGNGESLTSAATAAVTARANTLATGAPTISGTAQAGQTLTADTSGIDDEDGLTNPGYSYQWVSNGGNTDTDIGGETGSTYDVSDADVGKTIKVRVSFTDDADNGESLTSAATDSVVARPNTPATGAPTISGTAQAGQTLTAGISGIDDQDGLTNLSHRYQWIRNDGNDGNADADIQDATASTYIVSGDDVGNTIKVRVTFSDDAGNGESLTSAATAAVTARANSPATGAPTIGGTAQAGQTLTADTAGIDDTDGLTNPGYSYQWIKNDGNADTDIQDATASTYEVTNEDVGNTIKVRVSFTDDANNGESLTSAATDTVVAPPNTPATGAPTISGEAQAGQTLTADTSGIDDTDGLTNVSYGYQWVSNDGNADIQDATASTYEVTNEDVGNTIKVRVTFSDDAGNGESLTSAATAAVTARANSPATGAPTIGGTAQAGQTLTADTSGIDDDDGLTNPGYSYQWIRNDGGTDADIVGETASTYEVSGEDVGKTVKVRVAFTDDRENEETLTSATTAAVTARVNTPATGLPTISGEAQAGQTLTADTSGIDDDDGLTNVSYSYQWMSNDGNADTDIQDATASTYIVSDDDVGKTIKVRVSFTDDADNEETLTSAATAEVAARPNTPATGLPTISGTTQVGQTLRADTSGIDDDDGLTNVAYSYQWLAEDADISGETASTYTVPDDDVGKTIKVRVTLTDDRDNEESLTSKATDTVVAEPDSQDTDAPPRDPGETVDISVGATVAGDIAEASEVDWFKVSLLASETYRIDMRGAWGGAWAEVDGEIVWVSAGTLQDPKLLGVFGEDNALVPGTDEEESGNDRGDSSEGKNSRIASFSPPADGYYYIAATAELAWTGTYELTVTVVSDG